MEHRVHRGFQRADTGHVPPQLLRTGGFDGHGLKLFLRVVQHANPPVVERLLWPRGKRVPPSHTVPQDAGKVPSRCDGGKLAIVQGQHEAYSRLKQQEASYDAVMDAVLACPHNLQHRWIHSCACPCTTGHSGVPHVGQAKRRLRGGGGRPRQLALPLRQQQQALRRCSDHPADTISVYMG